MVRQTLCLKMADKYHQHFSGGIVGKWQKFRPFSNNLLWLFENGRKQTINHIVGILLENGRNFCRFLTTTTSCLKTAENKPSTILWGLVRLFSNNPKCFGRFPTKRFRPFSYNFFRPFSTSPGEVWAYSNRFCLPVWGSPWSEDLDPLYYIQTHFSGWGQG